MEETILNELTLPKDLQRTHLLEYEVSEWGYDRIHIAIWLENLQTEETDFAEWVTISKRFTPSEVASIINTIFNNMLNSIYKHNGKANTDTKEIKE
jgi:hypothetical protein